MKVGIMSHPVTKSLIIGALLSSSAAYAGAPGWQVSEISGNVTVARKGVVKIAQRQTKLAAGDVIKTGPKGRAILLRGGEYLVVSPASHIEIAEPAKSGKVTQIIEYLGNVLFRIDKKETPHFGVKTPYMAAVVKGTTFSVSVSQEGTAVQVTEGAVEVSTLDGGASELVTPGVIGMINSADPFDLVVIDGERRVIESPNKPAATGEKTDQVTAVKSTSAPSTAADKPDFSNLSGVVSAPIGEGRVELAELTNGLVRGDVGSGSYITIENAEEALDAVENANDNLGDEDGGAGNGEIDSDDEENVDQGEVDQGEVDQGEVDQGGDDQGEGDDDDRDDNDNDRDNDDNDGNNGHGNDPDGVDDSNPGRGNGNNGNGNNDDGNNGHGNDPDGVDDSNPGGGNGNNGKASNGNGNNDDGNNGHGNDPDGIDDSNPGGGNGNNGNKGRGNNNDDAFITIDLDVGPGGNAGNGNGRGHGKGRGKHDR